MAMRSRRFRLALITVLLMILQALAWQRPAMAAMTGNLFLDQDLYEGPNSKASIILIDADLTGTSVPVQVTSTSDATGFALTLTGSGGGYSGKLSFGPATDSATQTIKVADGDTVTVTYNDPAGTPPVVKSVPWYNRAAQPRGTEMLFDNRTPASAQVAPLERFRAVNAYATVTAYADADRTDPVAVATADQYGHFSLTFDNTSLNLSSVYLQAVEAGVPASLVTRVDAATVTTATPDATKITFDGASRTVTGQAGAVGGGQEVTVRYTISPTGWGSIFPTAAADGSFDCYLSDAVSSVQVTAQIVTPYGRQFASAPVTVDASSPPPPPVTTLPTPTGLVATVQPGQVALTWDAVTAENLAGYNIYRTNLATIVYVKLNTAPVTTTAYTDTTVLDSGLYAYSVRAVDSNGIQSGSASVGVNVPAPAPVPMTISLAPTALAQGYATPATVTVTGANVDFTAAAPTVRILAAGGTQVATGSNVQVQSATQFRFDLTAPLDRGAYQVEVTSGTKTATAALSVTGWPACDSSRTTKCITSFTVDGVSRLNDPTLTLDVWQSGALQIQVKSGGSYDLGALTGSTFEIGLNTGDFDPISLAATGTVSAFTVTPAPGSNTITFRATPSASAWLTSGCGVGNCGDETTRADVAYSAMLIASVNQMDAPPGLTGAALTDFNTFRTNARGTYIGTNAQSFSSPYLAGGAFRFDVAAPHLKPDGSPNTGFFTAFLPDRLLQNYWGVADPAAAHLITERTDGANTTAVAPTVTAMPGGLKLDLAGFSYSSPSFSIQPVLPPGDVTSVAVLPGDGQLTVSFTPPAGTNFRTANIYLRPLGATNWTTAGSSATGATTALTGLTNGTAYTVNIRSVGVDGTEYTPGAVADNSAAGYVPRAVKQRLEADYAVPAGVDPAVFAAALNVSGDGFAGPATYALLPEGAPDHVHVTIDLAPGGPATYEVLAVSNSAAGFYWTRSSVTAATTGAGIPDGAYLVYVTAYTPAAFQHDTAAPQISITAPADGALLSNKRPVFTASAIDDYAVTGLSAALSSDGGATYQPVGSAQSGAAYTVAPAADLADGAYMLQVTATDAAGNTGTRTVSFTVDTTPPQIDAVTINDGATSTETRSVTVALTATDAAQMQISEAPDFAGAVWQPYARQVSFQLSSGNGLKTVRVKVRDTAGNESVPASAQIQLAIPAPPPPPPVIVPAPYVTISAAVTETREATIAVNGTANPGAAVSVGGTSVTASGAGTWGATVSLQEGSNTIVATNGAASASVTVLRDSTPPALTLTASAVQTTEETATLTATTEAGARVRIGSGPEATGSTTATVTLQLGANWFTATATDRLGNTASQSVKVVRIARPFTRVIAPDQPASVTYENLTVNLPEQLAAEPLQFALEVPQPGPATPEVKPAVATVAAVVEVKANLEQSHAPLTVLPKHVRLTFAYDPARVSDPAGLKIYWYDPNGQVWVALGGQVDTTAHTITAEVDHFTLFAVMAPQQAAPVLDPVPAQVQGDSLTVTGTAAPGAPLTLMVNGRTAQSGQADAAGHFRFTAPLQPGRSLLYVKGDGALASKEAVVFATAPAVQPQPQPAPEPQPAPQPAAPLTDVQAHWARTAIERMVGLGVVRGYEDQTFRPEQSVTRLEFAVMVARALGLPQADGALTFADADQIPAWATGTLGAAVKAGIIQGREDGRFDAGALVTRAEVAVMIGRALKYRGLAAQAAPAAFTDAAAIPTWAQGAVGQTVGFGLVTGYEDGSFGPDRPTTRAEAAVLLSRLLDAK